MDVNYETIIINSRYTCINDKYDTWRKVIRKLFKLSYRTHNYLVCDIYYLYSKHHHLLDYIITRKHCEYISNCTVSDFISDHRALHTLVRCIRPHPVRKRMRVRALRRIDGERLDSDLAGFTVDNECVNVNIVVAQYNEFLSSLLNKHASLKEIDVVERPLNDWMTENILALKQNS